MTEFLVFLPSGIAIGSVYALVALGLVLTYKTSGIFNSPTAASPPWRPTCSTSCRSARAGTGPSPSWLPARRRRSRGLIMERLAALLSSAPTVMVVVATVGLLVLLQSLMTAIYGPANIL